MKSACGKVRLYQNKFKKRRRRKAIILLTIFLTFLVAGFVYVFCVVNPIVVEATRHTILSLSTSAVSDAVYDVLIEDDVSYEDLVNVEYDNNGNVALISLQTVTLNLIARRFYQVAQTYLDEMGQTGIDVALGTFTGLPFLSGIGPKINLKLTPIGAMTATFESSFSSVGINQTIHSLYIRLYASVSLILPAYTTTIDSVTEVLVVESIIVGEIPEIYFGSNSVLSFTPS